ncbi:MAG: DUF4430 domain-containing protein [Butyricicoccus sp.]
MWWKTHKWKVIVPLLILAVLAGAFWYGGSAPGLQGLPEQSAAASGAASSEQEGSVSVAGSSSAENPADSSAEASASAPEAAEQPAAAEPPVKEEAGTKIEERPGGAEGGMNASEKLAAAAEIAGGSSPGTEKGSESYSESQGMVIDPSTGKDKYMTDPVPEGKPIPVEPQDAVITDTALTCTLSVRCDTILNNIGWLDPEKVELVPEDGVIFPMTQVTFYEGESVFNVLQREMKKAKIHMEFENTPIYNSAYIEGIHNLYEFDCGELSGWMYKVNGWFPNYGCSRYQLKDGDVVEWVYTCDLGVDVGGYYAAD